MLKAAHRAGGLTGCLLALWIAVLLAAPRALAGGGTSAVTCQGTGCNLFAQTPGRIGHTVARAATHPAAASPASTGQSTSCSIPVSDGGLAGFVIPACGAQLLNMILSGIPPVILPVAAGTRPAAATAVLPAAATLARAAESELNLPSPVIRSSPAAGGLQLTQLPVWLWVAQATWQPRSRTAAVPGESVTATSTPVSASWHMGDGSVVTCHGPGTPYTAGDDPAAPSPTCGHTYTRSSAGQPSGAYHVTVTITWDIAWHGTGGAAGTLPPLFTAAAVGMRVAESQAINTAGGL
jgi:hypothetical protein